MANPVKRKPDFAQVQVANKKARWGGPALSAYGILMNLSVPGRFDGRSRAFFNSDPNIDDDDEPESSPWQFIKPLGEGGFGAVGLWARKDRSDFCAVKDDTYDSDLQYGNGQDDDEAYRGMYKGIVKEAVYQAQLNEFQGVENHIVHLRRYKAYHNNADPLPNGSVAAPGDRIRLYFNYAPFRDLEVLRMRYRAWEKHLPELFIWHVFHSLALAVQLLNEGAWTQWHQSRSDPTNIRKITSRADAFLNHFDLKLENIFLGAPAPQIGNTPDSPDWDPCADYPQILLADFGLADLLVEDNQSLEDTGTSERPMPNQGRLQSRRGGWPNPRAFWGQGGTLADRTARWGIGTRYFHPTEQLRFSSNWIQPGNRQTSLPATGRRAVRPTFMNAQAQVYNADDAMGIRFTEKSNIWAIGKVLFDLTLLVERDFYLSGLQALPNDPTAQQTVYNVNRGHMLSDLQTSTTPQYSDKLRKLISKCMAISQDDRPSVQELLASTQSNLDTWKDNARKMIPAQRQDELRVYYKGNEINDMAVGPATFVHTAPDFEKLMNDVFRDLADLPLVLPDSPFQLLKAADAETRRDALVEGDGGPFRMQIGVGGQVEFVPPVIDDADIDGVRINLSIKDEPVQRARRFIENRVRQELRARNITEQWLIDAEIAKNLKDRSKGRYVSAEDISIISVLQAFYHDRITWSAAVDDNQTELTPVPQFDPLAELPPPPTEEWLSVTVTAWSVNSSLIFSHNSETPQELRPLAEGAEFMVRAALKIILDANPQMIITRRYLIRRTFEYLERAQADHAANSATGPTQERMFELAKFADFMQDVRRRYKGLGVPERSRNEAEDAGYITDVLFLCSTGELEYLVNSDPTAADNSDTAATDNLNPAETDAERVLRQAQEATALLEQGADQEDQQQQQQQQSVIPAVAPAPAPVKGGPRQLASGAMGKYCKHPCFTGINPRTGLPCGHTGCCHQGVA